MKSVCIVVGHSPKDGGCFNATHGLNEYDYNVVLSGLIAENLHRAGFKPVIVFRGDSYTGMVNDVNATGADIAIELHCNGVDNKSVQGTETLHWHNSKNGKRLAECLQKPIVAVIGENDRGLKPINDGGRGAPFLKLTKMPSAILEPFFISNDDSLASALELRSLLAHAVTTALVAYFED